MAEAEKPAPAPAPVPVKAAPPKLERWVVEEHKSFEIMGSTCTFRLNQILMDPREVRIAQEHGVALRHLSPIR